MPSYTDINAQTWDRWAADGCEWSVPISHEEYLAADESNFRVFLTPCVPVPHSWFGSLKGARLLGLASGGGQQMPVFAKLGAECTVFDYSLRQLEAERMVAAREGYDIRIVRGDMTRRLPFDDACFDLIFHPVSNCYVEDVGHVWRECFRVLRPGGRLLAGFDNGVNFLCEENAPLTIVNRLPFNPLRQPPEVLDAMLRNDEGVQFGHTMEEELGGQLAAGFVLTALYEDRDRPGGAEIGRFLPQYMATLARKASV